MESYLTGLTIGLGLIVAIGAQNAWVLSMSLRRVHPYSCALVCIAVDATLIGVGLVTLERLQRLIPSVLPLFTWFGIALLSWFVLQNILHVIRGRDTAALAVESQRVSRSAVIAQAFAISLLNPHVYLDTVLLMGSVGVNQNSLLFFWLGGFTASASWFLSLAAMGKPLSRWLVNPNRWRVFDGLIALFMAWVVAGLYHTL